MEVKFFGVPLKVTVDPEFDKKFLAFKENAIETANELESDLGLEMAFRFLVDRENLTFDLEKADDPEYMKLFIEDEVEFFIAGLLNIDGLLPKPLRQAFVKCVFDAQFYLDESRLACPPLFVFNSPRGRPKQDDSYDRLLEVFILIDEGVKNTEAYKRVANKYFKSEDTIRRDYERAKKEGTKLLKTNGHTGLITVTKKRTYSISRDEGEK